MSWSLSNRRLLSQPHFVYHTHLNYQFFLEMTKRTADSRVKRERKPERAPEYLVETWTADSKHAYENLETF